MGGIDKPLVSYRGRGMVEHILDSVPSITKHISANRNIETYADLGAVFSDQEVRQEERLSADCQGPLLGILGGLRRCNSDWLLVSPGDTPELGDDWFMPLLEGGDDELARVIFDGEQQQHLHAFLHKSLADGLKSYLQTGAFQVWRWLEQINAQPKQALRGSEFVNINSLEAMPRSD